MTYMEATDKYEKVENNRKWNKIQNDIKRDIGIIKGFIAIDVVAIMCLLGFIWIRQDFFDSEIVNYENSYQESDINEQLEDIDVTEEYCYLVLQSIQREQVKIEGIDYIQNVWASGNDEEKMTIAKYAKEWLSEEKLVNNSIDLYQILNLYIDTLLTYGLSDDEVQPVTSLLEQTLVRYCGSGANGIVYMEICQRMDKLLDSPYEAIQNIRLDAVDSYLDSLDDSQLEQLMINVQSRGWIYQKEIEMVEICNKWLDRGYWNEFEQAYAYMESKQYDEMANMLENERLPYGYFWYQDGEFVIYPTGVALLCNVNEGIYFGEMENGVRSGQGIQVTMQDGRLNRYDGQWKENSPNGQGTYYSYDSDGKRLTMSGNYTNGKEDGTMTLGWWDSQAGQMLYATYNSIDGQRQYLGYEEGIGYIFARHEWGIKWYNESDTGIHGTDFFFYN